jgi:SPP1 gp7 family putative phage head morphogenesis protein
VGFAATADPLRFEDAVKWFRKHFPLTEEQLESLKDYAGDRAWTVAGVAQLDIVLDVWLSLADAIEKGTPLDDWKKQVRSKLTKAWGVDNPARLETIFRTNVQTAYNRGRFVQMTDPAVVKLRPFWMYDSILDSRTSPVCNARHKVTLRADHPWWDANYPPLHHRCRSAVRTLTKRDAAKQPAAKRKPPESAAEPGKGFGVSPRFEEPWQPDAKKYPPELWSEFQSKQKKR